LWIFKYLNLISVKQLGQKADHSRHLVPRLMCGAISSLSNMSSWHGVSLHNGYILLRHEYTVFI